MHSSWFLLLLAFVSASIVFAHEDLHHHFHEQENDEPAHYKYSKEANRAHSHDHATNPHENKNVEKKTCYWTQLLNNATAFVRQQIAHLDSIQFDKKGYLNALNDPKTRLWVYSLGSTVLISAAPFIILFVIPVQSNKPKNRPLLKVLLAFGAGGLLGDAFLHLIPHSSNGGHQEHGHGRHEHDNIGLFVLTGFTSFYLVETLVRVLGGRDEHRKSKASNERPPTLAAARRRSSSRRKPSPNTSPIHDLNFALPKDGIAIAALLNIFADFAHNVTDGLAIGASFLAGTTMGVVTTLAVLVHEVPHEIGDFAILVQSGYSKRQAMATQLLTAVGAIGGCVGALVIADSSALAYSTLVLPFTAGGFIYIAAVSVIPELFVERDKSNLQSLVEILAFISSIAFMHLVAAFE